MKYLEILVKLRKIIRSINLESKKIEKEFGVSIPQLLVLQYLSGQDKYRASASAIKNYINLNASTVSGIITRLERKGLVGRFPHPEDKRASYINLTAKGAELLERSPTTLQQKLSSRIKTLSPEQVAALEEGIDLLIYIMDAQDIEAAPLITAKEIPEEKP